MVLNPMARRRAREETVLFLLMTRHRAAPAELRRELGGTAWLWVRPTLWRLHRRGVIYRRPPYVAQRGFGASYYLRPAPPSQ